MPQDIDVIPVLRYLGAASSIDVSPALQRSMREACRHGAPFERLARGGRAAGLALSATKVSTQALVAGASAWPLVGYSEGHAAYFIIEGARRGRIRMRIFGPAGAGPAQWVNAADLSAALQQNANEPLDLLHLSVSRPLEDLRQPDGSVWQRLFALVRSERQDLWIVVTYAIGVGVLSLATPLAVQSLINTVAFGTVLQPVLVLSVLLLAALTASAVLKVFELVVVEHIARRVFVRTAVDFSRRVPLVRREACKGQRLEELVNRFYDVVVVEKSIVTLIFDGLSATLQISVGLLLLAVYHPFLLAFDLILITAMALIIFGLGRRAVTTAVVESKKKHAVAAWLEELAGTPSAFRSVTGQQFANQRADEIVQGWLHARSEHFRILVRQQGGMLALQALASGLLILIGGFLVLERQLTLGQLVAAEVIMTLTVSSLGKLGKLLGKLYDLLAALDKLGSVVDLPLLETGGEPVGPARTPLAVGIQHPRLTTEIAPGTHVALSGEDAAQLPNLAHGLVGLGALDGGQLAFDGVDARSLDGAQVAEQVMVLDSDEIFDGTLYDNITLQDGAVSPAQVRDALTRVGLNELEEHMSGGLEHRIRRDGWPLKTGQQNLLLFARLIVRRPRLVVVTRVMDTMTPAERARMLGILIAPDAPWTTICISDHMDLLDQFPVRLSLETGAKP